MGAQKKEDQPTQYFFQGLGPGGDDQYTLGIGLDEFASPGEDLFYFAIWSDPEKVDQMPDGLVRLKKERALYLAGIIMQSYGIKIVAQEADGMDRKN